MNFFDKDGLNAYREGESHLSLVMVTKRVS